MLLYDEFTIEQLSYVKVHSVDIVLFIYCYDLNITFSSIYRHGSMVFLILSSQSSILLNQLSCSTPIIVAKWLIVMYVQANNISPHFIDTGHTTDDPNPKYFTYIIYILSYVSHLWSYCSRTTVCTLCMFV